MTQCPTREPVQNGALVPTQDVKKFLIASITSVATIGIPQRCWFRAWRPLLDVMAQQQSRWNFGSSQTRSTAAFGSVRTLRPSLKDLWHKKPSPTFQCCLWSPPSRWELKFAISRILVLRNFSRRWARTRHQDEARFFATQQHPPRRSFGEERQQIAVGNAWSRVASFEMTYIASTTYKQRCTSLWCAA